MYDQVIEQLLKHKAVKVVRFINKSEIIRAVRTRYGNNFSRGNMELTVTRGRPNYQERLVAKKMGSKIKGFILLKHLPKRK